MATKGEFKINPDLEKDVQEQANDDYPKVCCTSKITMWTMIVFGLVLAGIGAALTPIGLNKQKELDGLNPSKDFSLIDPNCTISDAIFLRSDQRTCKSDNGGVSGGYRRRAYGTSDQETTYPCGCTDIYFYIISAPQLADIDQFYAEKGGDYQYDSLESPIDREGVNDCSEGSVSPPKWTIGEENKCWRPSNPEQGVSDLYRCGNDECIKVFDPEFDVDAAGTGGKGLWITGAVLLSVALPFFIAAFVVKMKYV